VGIAWKGEQLDVLYHYCQRAAELLEEYEKSYGAAKAHAAAAAAASEASRVSTSPSTNGPAVDDTTDTQRVSPLSDGKPSPAPAANAASGSSHLDIRTGVSIQRDEAQSMPSGSSSAILEHYDGSMDEDTTEDVLHIARPQESRDNEQAGIDRPFLPHGTLAGFEIAREDIVSEAVTTPEGTAQDTLEATPSISSLGGVSDDVYASEVAVKTSTARPSMENQPSRSFSSAEDAPMVITDTPPGPFSLRASVFLEPDPDDSESRLSSTDSARGDNVLSEAELMFRIETSQYTWPMPLPRVYPGPRLAPSTTTPVTGVGSTQSSFTPSEKHHARSLSVSRRRSAR